MFGTFLYGEVPFGICPNVVGEGLFFNSEVLKVNSVINQFLHLYSLIDSTSVMLNSPISGTAVKLESEVYETTL